ncbi:hypothetical protein LTR10_010451 [Elasticomyces elasticus]|nr:hypothetical protein LTR10_010451 [Elasticomyces elasticus]KAK4972350.1 hypothetical protein LTR42_006859 [Elasticomyces elasticus]
MSTSPPPSTARALRSTTRNPLRRPRQSDGDSLQRTAPRRKRSKLSATTFTSRDGTEETETESRESNTRPPSTAPSGSTKGWSVSRSMVAPTEMPIHGSRRTTVLPKHRPLKGDGATTLTQNDVYSVKLLPSTPTELKGVHYRGSLLSLGSGLGHQHTRDQHLALAVTKDKAVVWDYTSHAACAGPAVRTFDLPASLHPRLATAQELPFGALVPGSTAGGGGDVGLLVVNATGKAVYWPSIERAAAKGLLFQDKAKEDKGVEGKVEGLSYNESVTSLTATGPSVYLLTTCTGRIAQLTLHNQLGQPAIISKLLPNNHGPTQGFGSTSSFSIGGLTSWLPTAISLSGSGSGGATGGRSIVGLRTRAIGTKAQKTEVISLTKEGGLTMFSVDTRGGGGQTYDGSTRVDLREVLARELGRDDEVVMHDLAFASSPHSTVGNGRSGMEVAKMGTNDELAVWVLCSAGGNAYLVQLRIVDFSATVERVNTLQSLMGARTGGKEVELKLMLPATAGTAFVVCGGKGVAVVDISGPEGFEEEDPNAQLHGESYLELADQHKGKEEVVWFKGGADAVLDAVAEDSRTASPDSKLIVFVKGVGVVRINATGGRENNSVDVKGRIEQAVFYGALQGAEKILDFRIKHDGWQEFERAMLRISDEVLRSDTSFISPATTSVEAHLEFRMRALRALVDCGSANYSQQISREVRWRLLADAEKVSAALEMWRVFSEHCGGGEVKRTATVVDELVALLDMQTGGDEDGSADDRVRRFFVKGLSRVNYLLSHISGLVTALKADAGMSEKTTRCVDQADELWSRALNAAFAFRAENAETVYGLEVADLAGVPELWTSTKAMLKAGSEIPKLSGEFARVIYEKGGTEVDSIKRILSINPELIELGCRIWRESIAWVAANGEQRVADEMRRAYDEDRYKLIRTLPSIGSSEQGMQLAERYRDMGTLTELVVGETQYYLEELSNPNMSTAESDIATGLLQEMTERIGRYFDKFGEDWADAFFDQAFSNGGDGKAGVMVERAQTNWPNALTRYLRKDPAGTKRKICWFNDIGACEDFRRAGETLAAAALERETRLWAKKVELSLSKLALLAAQEQLGELVDTVNIPTAQLRISGVQERVYEHVRQECMGALDRDAEVLLAMDTFGKKVEDYGSLKQVLAVHLEQLLNHDALSPEELIDVLTLMDNYIVKDPIDRPVASLNGTEFSLALEVLDAAAPSMPQARFETLLQLIWKRCYIYDDWSIITSEEKGSTDDDVQERLRGTAPWRTMFPLQDSATTSRPDSPVRVLEPSDCVGAACRAEDLAHRFPNRDLLDPIVQDNQIQDEILLGYVADRSLDAWIQGCQASVKMAVEQKAEELAEYRHRERIVHINAREREEKLSGMQNGFNGVKGVAVANGHTNGHGIHAGADIEMS